MREKIEYCLPFFPFLSNAFIPPAMDTIQPYPTVLSLFQGESYKPWTLIKTSCTTRYPTDRDLRSFFYRLVLVYLLLNEDIK